MLTDYHTHSYRCGHAVGTMRQYVESAISRGIGELGLTDHIWLYFEDDHSRRNPTFAMSENEFAAHVEEMLRLRDEYAGRINIRISVEADYIAGREDELLAILDRYPFDYVLGSVHFLDGWPLDAPEEVDRYRREKVSEIYLQYYAQLQRAVRLGCFDLLAHLDLPKKFGFLPEVDISATVEETLTLIASSGVAVEVSSAGLRKPIGEIYPAPEILSRMHQLGIPIALSSDAHAPEEVGADYETSVLLAREAGYRELVTFERRIRGQAPLGECACGPGENRG